MASKLRVFRVVNHGLNFVRISALGNRARSCNAVSYGHWSKVRNSITNRLSLVLVPSIQPEIEQSTLTRGCLIGRIFHTLPSASRRTYSTLGSMPLSLIPDGNLFFRGVTTVSKKGKRKTCKAVAKRFLRTGKGKLKRWRCGKHHNQSKKSSRRKRFLRKPTYASKTQLKTLNKMLNGW